MAQRALAALWVAAVAAGAWLFSRRSEEPAPAVSSAPAAPHPARAPEAPGERCVLRGRVAPGAGRFDQVVVRVVSPPSPAEPPAEHMVALEGHTFTMPVLVIRRGDTIVVKNHDKDLHHLSARPFDLARTKSGALGHHRFDQAGTTRIRCANHPSERVDVLIVDTAHWAFVRADGTWQLNDVPRGPKTLEVWEPNGATQAAAFDGCGDVPTLQLVPAQALE